MTDSSLHENLAMIFPGQGSQSLGMMAKLAQVYPSVQETFSEASAASSPDAASDAAACTASSFEPQLLQKFASAAF